MNNKKIESKSLIDLGYSKYWYVVYTDGSYEQIPVIENRLQPLLDNLDVVSVEESKDQTIIDFNNPLSNHKERVVITHFDGKGKIDEILYIPAYHKVGEMYTKDEYEMEDLEELYHWIDLPMIGINP